MTAPRRRLAFAAGVTALVVVAAPSAARAFTLKSFGPASWGATDATLGFASDAKVEGFESPALLPALDYEVTNTTPQSMGLTAMLPATFDPTMDQFGQAFVRGVWDGVAVVVNTPDNQSHAYSVPDEWGRLVFRFENGATRVGFSLDQMEKGNTLYVNGAPLGVLGTAAGTTDLALGTDRNGYLVIVAGSGEEIDSVAIDNGTTGDGWVVDHLVYEELPPPPDGAAPDAGADGASDASADGGAPDAASAQSLATLFVTDALANRVYRYTLAPTGAPALGGTVTSASANDVALNAAGELFVLDYASGAIDRFLYPFGPAYPNGRIAGVGLASPEHMQFVGEELWILDSDDAGGSAPQPIVRLGFDAHGNAAAVGVVSDPALTGANRGMLWDAATSDLYVTECCGSDRVLHFHPDLDGSLTQLNPVTGGGLSNPHGMVITPGRELLVANHDGPSISRFALDVEGQARPVAVVTGKTLTGPIGLALTPWGEVFVANSDSNEVARFTLGPAGDLVANGSFLVGGAPSTTSRIGWIEIVPTGIACAPPTSAACNPPLPDFDAGADARADARPTGDAGPDVPAATLDAREGGRGDAAPGGSGAAKSGCGCATAPGSSTPGAALLLALGPLLLRRRRVG